jgi:hypothetical protein
MAENDMANKRIEAVAQSALLTVVGRAAMPVAVAVLVWGFNRLDTSISNLSETIVSIQLDYKELKTRVDYLEGRK